MGVVYSKRAKQQGHVKQIRSVRPTENIREIKRYIGGMICMSVNMHGLCAPICYPPLAFRSANCALRSSLPARRSASQSPACVSMVLLLYPPPLSSGTSEHRSSNPCLIRFRRFCSERMWFVRFCSSDRFSRTGLMVVPFPAGEEPFDLRDDGRANEVVVVDDETV